MLKKLYDKACLYLFPLGKIRHFFAPHGSVLVYLGVNWGGSLDKIFLDYEKCYCFEANPELYAYLKRKYQHFSHVKLFNYAVSDKDGESTFYVTSQQAQCSSLSKLSQNSSATPLGIQIEKEITVPTINLYNFLKKENVERITCYISDIQGHDLAVLKTMKSYIEKKKIQKINCEVHASGRELNYVDAPFNNETGYEELLSGNYRLVAAGWGLLEEGEFMELPEEARQLDQLWIAK